MISSIRSDADSTALFDYLPYFRLGFSSQLLLVIVFALCLIISGMMASVSPLLTSALVDNISKKTSYDTIMISSALIGFAALIDIVVSYLSTLLSMRITTVAAFSIVRSKIDELVRMPFELYFEQESAEKTQYCGFLRIVDAPDGTSCGCPARYQFYFSLWMLRSALLGFRDILHLVCNCICFIQKTAFCFRSDL